MLGLKMNFAFDDDATIYSDILSVCLALVSAWLYIYIYI